LMDKLTGVKKYPEGLTEPHPFDIMEEWHEVSGGAALRHVDSVKHSLQWSNVKKSQGVANG
jgi:hypothetical protein